MVIYKTIAVLNNGDQPPKEVVLLWEKFRKANQYFEELTQYSRCMTVSVWRLETDEEHCFQPKEMILSYVRR